MIVPHSPEKIALAILTLWAIGLSFLVAPRVKAQVAGATLSGTVMDPSSKSIPLAQVSIKNLATGTTVSVTSDADGFYLVPNLIPGNYEVKVSASGFATTVQTGITLTVGAKLLLSFTLKVGQVEQQVHVNTAPPNIELSSSSIGGLVGSTAIVELPLNGRDWTQLATLQPGVNAIPTQDAIGASSNRGVRGFGNQISISGTRPQFNNYRLDGISIIDYAAGAPGSVNGVALGVDAVAEFSVLTANYSAEYGRTSGGVINAITKSGANQFHGDAYWFLRDEDFDARNYFDQSDKAKPPFHRNQFGGSLGGPIWTDHTFFFADYEGFRQDLGTTNINVVPSMDARNGIIHNPDGTTTIITVDPAVKPYLPLYPLPNAGAIGDGNTGHFDIATNSVSVEDFVTTRIDHKFSDKDSIFGSWFYDKASYKLPDSFDNVTNGNFTFREMVALEETHVFSRSFVNSLRFGYNRVTSETNEGLVAVNPIAGDLSLGSFPGRTAPSLSVSGLTALNGGIGALSTPTAAWNSYQLYDDAFLTKGLHSLKFGFAFERMQTNYANTRKPNGSFSFGSLTALLTNAPKSFTGQPPTSVPGPIDTRQSLFGGYVQDDWHLRPNLTLNLGLRYEAVSVPTEVRNRLSSLATLESAEPNLGSPFFDNPTKRNFEPRVGFAWDPFHDGKTAVRGAFGMFDALPMEYEFFAQQVSVFPYAAVISVGNLPPGSFPTEAAQSPLNPTNLEMLTVQQNPPRSYVMTWNLNLQRQLTQSTALTVGYVGSHGVHIYNRTDDANIVLPDLTSQGYLWPAPIGSGIRVNPNWGQINDLYWGGTSLYDALEVQVLKRMSHGFQVQGSYTWGKSIDTGSAAVVGDPFVNSISSLFFFCPRCRRALSDFDIGQTLVVNYIWELPSPKGRGAVASHVLGGWELSGVITAESGVPFTPLIGGDPLGLNSTDPYAYPDRLSGPGCHTAVNPGNPNNYINLNCFGVPMATPAIASMCAPFPTVPGSCSNLLGTSGRNSLIGPGLVTWDFGIFKNTRISERLSLQLRAEFFNILNRPNFAVPTDNETLFDQTGAPIASAGEVDQTSTTAREIQFGAKLIW
jgi:Carboxypeptidase regulatory-like domain/TonB-dependent Receptor Plug Domain/TonB dependent receptor